MGGHQNAHKGERMEEKRLFVKDPLNYRKRAYLLAQKSMKEGSSDSGGGSSSSVTLHAALKMVKHRVTNINDPPKILVEANYLPGDSGELDDPSNDNLCQSESGGSAPLINGENLNKLPLLLMNFLPPKEFCLAETVGCHAEDAKGKAHMEPDMSNNGMNFEKLDLTLKL